MKKKRNASSKSSQPSIPNDPVEAPGGTLVRLRSELALQEFDVPGGNRPVKTTRLHAAEATRASTLLVRFPDGWERRAAGAYDCAEEFIVLEGELEMNGAVYRPNDWAYVPPAIQRRNTMTPKGALALARFSGPPRWRPDAGAEAVVRPTPLLEVPPGEDASPLGSARLLLREEGVSSWIVDGVQADEPAPVDLELLSLPSRVWAWVPEGAPVPRLEGRCFCRTFEAGGPA